METTVYTNELHESYLKRKARPFGNPGVQSLRVPLKCTVEVEGCSDQGVIADNFATHFSGCFTGNNRVEKL